MVAAGCRKEENPDPPNTNVVYVDNEINAPTTWHEDSVYVVKDCDVTSTLNIEPGAIIKFALDGYLKIWPNARLLASGTSEKPIVFTSLKDDAYGGDTNGDGDASLPMKKDWQNIDIDDASILITYGSVLEYCVIQYGSLGVGGEGALTIGSGSVTVKNCTIAHNFKIGLDAVCASLYTVIQSNTFFDNEYPLRICLNYSINDSNVFHNPQAPNEINTFNGIFVHSISGTYLLEIAVNWKETEVPFVLGDTGSNSGLPLTFRAPAGKLELGDNVVLKFPKNGGLVLESGPSHLVNNQAAGVAFTSIKDDSRKGDTNGDGNASSPGQNDWEGIYSAIFGGSYLNWDNIYFDSH